jgi:dihydrodipicolinate synthase/N-acetylneuraminate lyase
MSLESTRASVKEVGREFSREIAGIFCAIVTPMTSGGESVNLGCVGPLLSQIGGRGADGVVPLGTTGEFASLTFKEKTQVLAEVAATKGGLRMIVGCGSSSLRETNDLVALAGKKGADAVLVPPPYYFRNASEAGIEEYFSQVLERAEVAVLLYHVPLLTGIPIERKMLERLAARYPQLWGIKDTGGKIQDTNRYLASKPGRVLLGSDTTLLAGLEAGVQGIISACANVAPELVKAVYARHKSGLGADRVQERLASVRNSLRSLPFHSALKRWLRFQGIDAGDVRPPLQNLNQAEDDSLRQIANLYAAPIVK